MFKALTLIAKKNLLALRVPLGKSGLLAAPCLRKINECRRFSGFPHFLGENEVSKPKEHVTVTQSSFPIVQAFEGRLLVHFKYFGILTFNLKPQTPIIVAPSTSLVEFKKTLISQLQSIKASIDTIRRSFVDDRDVLRTTDLFSHRGGPRLRLCIPLPNGHSLDRVESTRDFALSLVNGAQMYFEESLNLSRLLLLLRRFHFTGEFPMHLNRSGPIPLVTILFGDCASRSEIVKILRDNEIDMSNISIEYHENFMTDGSDLDQSIVSAEWEVVQTL